MKPRNMNWFPVVLLILAIGGGAGVAQSVTHAIGGGEAGDVAAIDDLESSIIALKADRSLAWSGVIAELVGGAGLIYEVPIRVATPDGHPPATSMQANVGYDSSRLKLLGVFAPATVSVDMLTPVGGNILTQVPAAIEANAKSAQLAGLGAALASGHAVYLAPSDVGKWDAAAKRAVLVVTPATDSGAALTQATVTSAGLTGDPTLLVLRFELLGPAPPDDTANVWLSNVILAQTSWSESEIGLRAEVWHGSLAGVALSAQELAERIDTKSELLDLYTQARALLLAAGVAESLLTHWDPGSPQHKTAAELLAIGAQ